MRPSRSWCPGCNMVCSAVSANWRGIIIGPKISPRRLSIRAYLALRSYPAQRIREMRVRGWVWTIALNLLRNEVRGLGSAARSGATGGFRVRPIRAAGFSYLAPAVGTASLPPAPSGDPAVRGGTFLSGDIGGDRTTRKHSPQRCPPRAWPIALGHRRRDSQGGRQMILEKELERLSVTAPKGVAGGVALGTGLSDGFSLFESPLGSVVVAFNPLGVSAVDLFTDGFEERFAERFRRQLLEARPPRDWSDLILRALAKGTPRGSSGGFALRNGLPATGTSANRGHSPRRDAFVWMAGQPRRAPQSRSGSGTDHGSQSRSPGDPLSPSGAVRRPDRPLRAGGRRAQAHTAPCRRSHQVIHPANRLAEPTKRRSLLRGHDQARARRGHNPDAL